MNCVSTPAGLGKVLDIALSIRARMRLAATKVVEVLLDMIFDFALCGN